MYHNTFSRFWLIQMASCRMGNMGQKGPKARILLARKYCTTSQTDDVPELHYKRHQYKYTLTIIKPSALQHQVSQHRHL